MWYFSFLLCAGVIRADANANITDTQAVQNHTIGTRAEASPRKVYEPTVKLPRDLTPKLSRTEKLLLGIKKHPFSSRFGERRLVIVKKVHGQEAPALVPHSRSLDSGLGSLMGGYSFDLSGQHQGLLPTSGTPNSLDHLYLPEIVAKNYAKPLEFNGVGPFSQGGEINASPPYPSSGFRGNPIDVHYHNEFEHGRFPGRGPPPPPPGFADQGRAGPPHSKKEQNRSFLNAEGASNDDGNDVRRPPERDNFRQRFPQSKPHGLHRFHQENEVGIHLNGRGSGGDELQDGANEGRDPQPEGPPGYDQVEGDAGIRGILNLANLINSNGFPQQLANLQGASQLSFGGPDEHRDGDFEDGDDDDRDYAPQIFGHTDPNDDFNEIEDTRNKLPGFGGFDRPTFDDDSRGGNFRDSFRKHYPQRLKGPNSKLPFGSTHTMAHPLEQTDQHNENGGPGPATSSDELDGPGDYLDDKHRRPYQEGMEGYNVPQAGGDEDDMSDRNQNQSSQEQQYDANQVKGTSAHKLSMGRIPNGFHEFLGMKT